LHEPAVVNQRDASQNEPEIRQIHSHEIWHRCFLFFFIKGMVWLAVFWFGWEFFANFFTDSQLP